MNLFKNLKLKFRIKNTGYKQDQQGIMRRYLREKENWEPHLKNSQRFITQWLADKTGKSIAVLGSGWLLDVPISELTDRFAQVDLFDIYHPEQIKKQFEKSHKVNLVTTDLTGGLINLAIISTTFAGFIDSAKRGNGNIHLEKYDYIVSVNLLAQLDILLCDFLKHRFGVSDTELNQIRQIVQQNHLQVLIPGKSCLISDINEIHLDSHKQVVTNRPLIFSQLPKPTHEEEWIWEFDTHRMYHPKFNVNFRVKALIF